MVAITVTKAISREATRAPSTIAVLRRVREPSRVWDAPVAAGASSTVTTQFSPPLAGGGRKRSRDASGAADEPHAVVHLLERRRRDLARLFGSQGQQSH